MCKLTSKTFSDSFSLFGISIIHAIWAINGRKCVRVLRIRESVLQIVLFFVDRESTNVFHRSFLNSKIAVLTLLWNWFNWVLIYGVRWTFHILQARFRSEINCLICTGKRRVSTVFRFGWEHCSCTSVKMCPSWLMASSACCLDSRMRGGISLCSSRKIKSCHLEVCDLLSPDLMCQLGT